MFAVRDKRSGKYLRNYSGSYNAFRMRVQFRLEDEHPGQMISSKKIHSQTFSLKSPAGAKLFKTEAGVATAFYSCRYRAHKLIPLAAALPWLEIVPVVIVPKVANV